MAEKPTPHELWVQADGDSVRYVDLLKEHGHLVPAKDCAQPGCHDVGRHYHEPNGRLVRTDVFGHPLKHPEARHGR